MEGWLCIMCEMGRCYSVCAIFFHINKHQLTVLTSEDLSSALSKAGPKLTVILLLDSLQQTTEFETFLGRKFGVPVSIIYFHLFFVPSETGWPFFLVCGHA